jgi:protein SCO1/2
VSYGLGPADASGDYEVTHSNVIYVFDNTGDAVLVGSEADGVQAFIHDLKQLLAA